MNILRTRGFTFYRRFPAAGSPPTTDFRWVLTGLFDDPGSVAYSFMCHYFMCLFGALQFFYSVTCLASEGMRSEFAAEFASEWSCEFVLRRFRGFVHPNLGFFFLFNQAGLG